MEPKPRAPHFIAEGESTAASQDGGLRCANPANASKSKVTPIMTAANIRIE
jgi:hypothetical protein